MDNQQSDGVTSVATRFVTSLSDFVSVKGWSR